MKDDIETLRTDLDQARTVRDIFSDNATALRKELAKAVVAVDEQLRVNSALEAENASLRKALDDRWAADLKAAKAIFAETGREAGFPGVKEVVAFYVDENDALRAKLENAQKTEDEG